MIKLIIKKISKPFFINLAIIAFIASGYVYAFTDDGISNGGKFAVLAFSTLLVILYSAVRVAIYDEYDVLVFGFELSEIPNSDKHSYLVEDETLKIYENEYFQYQNVLNFKIGETCTTEHILKILKRYQNEKKDNKKDLSVKSNGQLISEELKTWK